MGQKLDNAIGLYMEGIRDGKAEEALDKYLGNRYTQHSTGVADGKEGFLEFFIPFLERNPVRDIKIVRAIEDGSYVFLQAHQSLNNGQFYYVTGDFFDTDEQDHIVEHWDAIQEEVRETASGRSMVDGPSEIEDEEKTEENRQLITRFFQDVLIGGQFDQLTDYVSSEQYEQHSPSVEDGIAGLQKYMQELAHKEGVFSYVKAHKILVQGNFAAALSHVTWSEADWCFVDIFRMKDGKIVEHWDIQEKIGPQETWNNSGKF